MELLLVVAVEVAAAVQYNHSFQIPDLSLVAVVEAVALGLMAVLAV
jgi:hypothetical protein